MESRGGGEKHLRSRAAETGGGTCLQPTADKGGSRCERGPRREAVWVGPGPPGCPPPPLPPIARSLVPEGGVVGRRGGPPPLQVTPWLLAQGPRARPEEFLPEVRGSGLEPLPFPRCGDGDGDVGSSFRLRLPASRDTVPGRPSSEPGTPQPPNRPPSVPLPRVRPRLLELGGMSACAPILHSRAPQVHARGCWRSRGTRGEGGADAPRPHELHAAAEGGP